MESPPKTEIPQVPRNAPRVEFSGGVLQQIRQHARSSMHSEICGVLIGDASDGTTRISARIAGEGAAQGGAHVTFTQDTWEYIYKVKDAQFSTLSIVGWYHSHPGFGIFLSDYDLFIHENFFNAPHQVAWVFDPHSDEEGCFGWIGKNVAPLERIAVSRKHHPPAPEQTQKEAATRTAVSAQKVLAVIPKRCPDPAFRLTRNCLAAVVAILLLLGGFALPHYFPASVAFWSWIGSSRQQITPVEAAPASPMVETPNAKNERTAQTIIIQMQPPPSESSTSTLSPFFVPLAAPPTNEPARVQPQPSVPDSPAGIPTPREDEPKQSEPTSPADALDPSKSVPNP
jgi:proteasome lid subunit RPN8/RPN11